MKKIIIFILLSFFPCIVYAAHYQWVENGIHHFSNCQQPPKQRGNFNFKGGQDRVTTPKAKIEKKESETWETIKKIEDRNDKVEAIKKKYLQPQTDALQNIMQIILPVASKPAASKNEP